MARKADETRLESLQQAIESHPGQRPSFFASLLGCSREAVSRMLVTLNDRGVLYYEDERNGVWPFETKMVS